MPMDPRSDDDLIERHLAGDRTAFEAIVRRHGPALQAYLVARSGQRASAEDAFQDTFLAVLDGLPGYESRGCFRGWLFGVARRRTADLRRAASRRREAPLGDGVSGVEPPPEVRAQRAEDARRLGEAVERLSPKLRETYLLRTAANLTFREIAEALGCPLGTALARMRYALDRLRAELSEEGVVR